MPRIRRLGVAEGVAVVPVARLAFRKPKRVPARHRQRLPAVGLGRGFDSLGCAVVHAVRYDSGVYRDRPFLEWLDARLGLVELEYAAVAGHDRVAVARYRRQFLGLDYSAELRDYLVVDDNGLSGSARCIRGKPDLD